MLSFQSPSIQTSVKQTFTKQQFADYVLGWLESEEAKSDKLTMGNMKAALHNAKLTIDDEDDGIEYEVRRQEFIDRDE